MNQRSKTYIACCRPIELKTQKVTEQQSVETWEGARTAFVGDYIMMGVQGERWPVPANQFDELYRIIGKSKDNPEILRARKRIMEMQVYQTYEPLDFQVRHENFHVEAGYFLVRYNNNSCYPCEPSVFFETFEILRLAEESEYFNITDGEVIS